MKQKMKSVGKRLVKIVSNNNQYKNILTKNPYTDRKGDGKFPPIRWM